MSESKARTGFHPDDAEAFEVSRRAGRHALPLEEEGGLPSAANLRAANSDDPRDVELRAILRRMLDGDPYPVSGRRAPMSAAPQEVRPAARYVDPDPFPRHAESGQVREQASEPMPDLPDIVPDLLEGITEPQRPVAAPIDLTRPPRTGRWSLGIRSLAFVVATALTGAVVPTLLAPPPLYMSQAILHAAGEGAARQALLDVAAKRALAPSILSDVVARMKLDRDPEFTGARTGALGVAVDLLSGSGNASDAPSRAQAALRKGIAVGIDGQTGLLRLIATTGDPVRSADIANRLAFAILYDAAVMKAAGPLAARETTVDRSRKDFDRASAALTEFKARYGEDKIAAALTLQQQRQQLDGEIKAADQAVRSARARLSAVRSATPASVLSGALPADLSSAGLDDLRGRYSAAKAQLSQLSVQLGPRHPRLLAQQATVDDLAATIRSQLQRLAVSSEADVKAALEKQAALSAQMTDIGRKGSDVDLVSLAQLQDAVAAAQTRYEADQQSAAMTVPEASPPLTVLSQAVASIAPLDDHLAGNQAIGFLAGLGLALCAVFLLKRLAGAEPAEEPAADDSIAPPEQFQENCATVSRPESHKGREMERFSDSVKRGTVPTPDLRHDDGMELPDIMVEPSPPALDSASQADIADEWIRIRQELAALRAKVETYAARRHHDHG
ncbi:MAG: succinoglycan biosynthesis transport protein [Rhizobium sp.]